MKEKTADFNNKRVTASWSGSYPCFCSGCWTLTVDGRDVSDLIPDELRNSPMDTFGTYKGWRFVNWLEEFFDYEDGLKLDDWIAENLYWLSNITTDPELHKDIFYAINECDFRRGCCGGCI